MTVSISVLFFFNYGIMYLLGPLKFDHSMARFFFMNSGLYIEFNQ